jgi:hypothetical protein
MFWALLASGQINMRKVDGWQTLATQNPSISRLTLPPETMTIKPIIPANVPAIFLRVHN